MRKIKFRVWEKTDHKMYYGVGLTQCGVEVYENETDFPPKVIINRDRDCFEIMQYTGLKDNRGKEIYIGDILSTSNHDPAYDIWDEKNFGLTIVAEEKNKLGISFSNWSLDNDKDSIYNPQFIKVIGNIYENPELLKDEATR